MLSPQSTAGGAATLASPGSQSAVPSPTLQPTAASVPTPQQQSTGTGFKRTFYKRKLPSPPATEFSSAEGRQLFAEALADGHTTGFFKLMEQFNTQDEPAYCGLASIAMVLNALSIDPRRTWKGAWRWFHEEMLDCCRPLEHVKKEGITISEAACLARCNGARVTLNQYGSFTLEQFRQEIIDVCSSGEEHIVVSYSRKQFLQTGDGHFSPIGAYNSARDLVLILDVARFKYPPHWVPIELLYKAMAMLDPSTGQPRGFMRMSTHRQLDSVLFTLDVAEDDAWKLADEFVRHGAYQIIQQQIAAGVRDPDAIVGQLVQSAPLESLDRFLAVREAFINAISGSSPSSASPSPAPDQDSATLPATASATAKVLATAIEISASSGSAEAATAAGNIAPSATANTTVAAAAATASHCSAPAVHSCSSTALHTAPAGSSSGASTDQPDGAAVAGSNSSSSMAAAKAVAASCRPASSCLGPVAARKLMLDELRGMPLYQVVLRHLVQRDPGVTSSGRFLPEKLCMALLLVWRAGWQTEERALFTPLLDLTIYTVVSTEVSYLHEQLAHVEEVLASGRLAHTCGTCNTRMDCAAHGHG